MVYVSAVTQDLMMIPDAVYHELIFAYPCLSLRLFTHQCICSYFKMLENNCIHNCIPDVFLIHSRYQIGNLKKV